MSLPDPILFAWWASSISAGSLFLAIVGIYLYATTRSRRRKSNQTTKNAGGLFKDFIFVWVLLGILVFYIFTINIGSSLIFAAGNILVEALLIVYLLKNRKEESEER